MGIDEIKNLNAKEKIILINEIWESLEKENSDIKSPPWHKNILDERIKRFENNETKFISIEELKK